ncbi:MAG: DUF4102 domain-containing protein, partial [Alphaproteobacteria bacterium]
MGIMTAKAAAALTSPGRYHVGQGLYLQVRGPDRRSWIFRFMLFGRSREMGLGAFSAKPGEEGLSL